MKIHAMRSSSGVAYCGQRTARKMADFFEVVAVVQCQNCWGKMREQGYDVNKLHNEGLARVSKAAMIYKLEKDGE
jgi:hypothetical protein